MHLINCLIIIIIIICEIVLLYQNVNSRYYVIGLLYSR